MTPARGGHLATKGTGMTQRLPTDRTSAFAAAADRMLGEHPGDEQGRMLHAPGLKAGGRFYGFASADELVVKLPADRVAELIAGGSGEPCSPRPGRPMREWVTIPDPDEEACLAYLREARAFVAGS
ncbi:hypothetical protein [Blastococcus sp. VKM Ac-2987]|uniref:hypothetical protein n=1 Tax=Blastococcus sp. VKM Ac-2987 TaxID=3004141 RepID=UPI0022ABAE4A|nr:hypothetical protein [Blastococcus sp. VKM Ac-2987]MCZ2860900.1 hypothetical protein [Blastococcus sp. VKM Ac-2987]